jgi:hypothetical protein
MILEQLALVRLRFELDSLEAARVPAYKGDMLRMALLWWLSEFWCVMPERCREGCRRPGACLFGRLVQPPADPDWPPSIRRLIGDTPPPAYAIWDRHDRRTQFEPGTSWSFELTLAGEMALRQIPAVVAAVQQGAERGMGRVRLCSRLRQVSSLPGIEGEERLLATEQPQPEGVALTWMGYRLEEICLGYEQAETWASAWQAPVRHLSLRFLSPVKIKQRGQWMDEPGFSAVMRALVRRLRILSQVHGGGEWPQVEYGPLLDVAEDVRLEHAETIWTERERYSKSSGRHRLEGFVGQAWYAGEDLRPLLPVLWLGQWLHIGKAYVMGNGRYTIEMVG